jgi:class 3 adenylate cyclase
MDNLSAAMAKAFASIEGAVKGKTNPAFRSKYADLAAVVDAVKPHLAEHGLWFRQITHPAEHGVCVETVIHHASGQSLGCGPLFMPATKQDAQGYGSALTYARRYSLMAAFGVPAEDDDAQAAVASAPKPIARVAPARRADIQQQIDACADRAALNALYKSLSETERTALVDAFTEAAGRSKEAA